MLLYYFCKPLQRLGVQSEESKKTGTNIVFPPERNGVLNEEEMGLILEDIEGHYKQVKTLERKISRLQATITTLEEERRIRKPACEPQHVISIEFNVTERESEDHK